MNLIVIRRITGILMIVIGIQTGLFAQEKNDAIKAFNESVDLMKTDPVSAIGSFENCIKICEQVGDSANDVKEKAIKVLPDLYYQKASDLLLVDKNLPASISASKIALEVAKKYDSPTTLENTQKIMVQAYNAMGASFFTSNDNEKAIQAYDSALMINPDHQASIYNKALIYRKQGNSAKFGETMDLYIDKLKQSGDTSKTTQAKNIAMDYFRIAGGKANQANKLTEALNNLNTALKYGADKNVYYQFASVYNKQKNFSNAAASAKKGLEMETGNAEAKAKFYYELGTAQAGLGQTGEACETFKNSLYGPFMAASKAQRTNLKCK